MSSLPIDQELEKENELNEDFKNLSNEAAYEPVYKRLFALKRGINVAKAATDYLGLDSREYMLPLLQNTIRGVVESLNDDRKEILDAGAGNGEIVDWFFSPELERHAGRKRNILHIIESNPKLIEAYKEKVKQYVHINMGEIYKGRFQDFYGKSSKVPSQRSFDFINCMNSIYHLTDYTSNKCDPKIDIINLVKFLYGLLKPGGAMFISYQDMDSDFAKVNVEYHEEKLSDSTTTRNIKRAIQIRKSLLYDGEILKFLKEEESKSKTKAKIESHYIATSFYARSVADLAAMALYGEYLKPDDKKFDNNKLNFILKKFKESATTEIAKGERRKYGLSKADRGREVLWKVECPLVICIIRKDVA